MTATTEIMADRARIRQIIELPEARSNLLAAAKIALAGASVEEAKLVLSIASAAMTPEEVAETVNNRSRAAAKTGAGT